MCLAGKPCRWCPWQNKIQTGFFMSMLLFLWHWPGSHDCVGCPRDDESNNVDYRHLESLHCRPVQSITSSTNNLIEDRFQPWWEFVMVGICLWAIFFLLPKDNFVRGFKMCKYLFMNPPVGSAGRIWPNLKRDGESGPWNCLSHQQVTLEHWLLAQKQTTHVPPEYCSL